MNFMKTIVAAGLVAASTSAFATDITGAGSTFIYPVLSKWADGYKKESGSAVNYLSVDRVGRGHQADPGQDRDIRRHRQAAQG
jgi:phosphate transport system substrate-binding protein